MCEVSIIIPVYNVEKYLSKCLDSVCKQTLKNIEIICVNDCSLDSSLNILKSYAQRDNRIKIIDFKKNKGVAIARNEAIKVAKGEYVGFIDSDDWIDLNFYETLYTKAKCENSDLIIGNVIEEYEKTIKNRILYAPIIEAIKINKLNFNQLFWLGLYKKDMINRHKIKFIENCVYGEDRLFPLQASFYAKNFLYEDSVYYHYYRNTASITIGKKNERIIDSFILSVRCIFDFLNKENFTKENYSIVASVFWDNMLGFALSIDENLAEYYLKALSQKIIKNARKDIIFYYPFYEELSNFDKLDNFKQLLNNIKTYINKKIFTLLRKKISENI